MERISGVIIFFIKKQINMADYGIKVTKKGKGISSGTPEDYVLNSQYGAVKIVKIVSGSIVLGAGATVNTNIAHSQSFIPMVLLFTELSPGSGKYFMGRVDYAAGDADAGDVRVTVNTKVDGTNFKFELHNQGGSSKTVAYKAFIFGDNAQQ